MSKLYVRREKEVGWMRLHIPIVHTPNLTQHPWQERVLLVVRRHAVFSLTSTAQNPQIAGVTVIILFVAVAFRVIHAQSSIQKHPKHFLVMLLKRSTKSTLESMPIHLIFL